MLTYLLLKFPFLKFWREGLIVILMIIGLFLYIRIQSVKSDLKDEIIIREQAEANNKQCQSDKAITSEVSNDYQIQLSALNKQLASLKRVRENPRCIPITR